jgi:mRNA interferase RelE/StbE
MDIKSLKGDWKPYLRLRIGKIRIIFLIDIENNILKIYDIDNRGDIYK